MPFSPKDFWEPWEQKADSFEAVSEIIYGLFDKWSAKDRTFAWRGLSDARWALHSSLYRRLLWTSTATKAPVESALYKREGDILVELHKWGLHKAEYGRLSVLSQLAVLQHYGSPTRLIDITFNPWIGLWFAVEQKWANGSQVDDVDARLFAIDVSDRLINEQDRLRDWEDDLKRPWPSADDKAESDGDYLGRTEWTSNVFAWRPPHFHPRLAAQNGGFIFGGVPSTSGNMAWPKTTGNDRWRIGEVRQATSVPLRAHKLEATAGGPSANAVYTIRIKKAAIPEIRKRLQLLFDYRHPTIYPDYSGFANFAVPDLKQHP